MKHKFLIFLISIICLSFSNQPLKKHQESKVDGKVLFISYYEDINIEILKDYKNKKKRFRYLSVYPCKCPRYRSYNKTLEIDGEFKITDSSKIIFCSGCETNNISFPYQYSYIQLNSLMNDSIVEFTLNNKKSRLKPGKEYVDSIVSIEKEGKRVIQRTTIFHFENYGLVDKKNIFDSDGQIQRQRDEQRIRDSVEIEYIKQN
jgi:hypothetical protein